MRTMLALFAMLLVALPAAAQSSGRTPPAPAPREAAQTLIIPAMPQISAGHAVALGTGLFVGALAGSAMIHGGALATLIGAAAGLTVGHWYWTERHDEAD